MPSKHTTRKIVKNGRGSYYINIPKEIMKQLRFKERQKLVVRKVSNRIVFEDWPVLLKKNRGKKK